MPEEGAGDLLLALLIAFVELLLIWFCFSQLVHLSIPGFF